MTTIETYLDTCLALAKSIHFYSTTVAKQTLNYYQLHREDWDGCATLEDHPYIRHLRGLAAPSDPIAYFTSLDTGAEVSLTTGFTNHPATRQRILTDETYRSAVIKKLGEFGHQRLMGVLHPYTGDVPLKDGTILYYDPTLVESQEDTLIPDLTDWLMLSLKRWTNSGYIASDELFGAALHAIVTVHMASQIVTLRDKCVLTYAAHSFHVDAYLADYGLSMALPYLSVQQKYALYKRMPWLANAKGSQAAYLFYKRLLEQDSSVVISEYHAVVDDTLENVAVKGRNRYGEFPVTLEVLSAMTGQSINQTSLALRHGDVVDKLPLLKVSVASPPSYLLTVKRELLYLWGALSLDTSHGRYADTFTFTLPTGETTTLTAQQAFIYYAIHRSLPSYADYSDPTLFLFPLIQTMTGYTGLDLVEFTTLDKINREQFVQSAEKVLFTMQQLRTRIDVSPIDERVYWEAEFPRHYTAIGAILPDKQTWLTAQNLPELTDDYLDALFNLATGYELTMASLAKRKALAYQQMLEHVLSGTLKVTTNLLPNAETTFMATPVHGLLSIRPL